MRAFSDLLRTALETPVEGYVRLVTSDSESTLVAGDGSLVTVLQVLGSRSMVGESEREAMASRAATTLQSAFARPGTAIEINYLRDPEAGRQVVERQLRPARVAASNIGIDLDPLFDAQVSHLGSQIARDELHLVLWTRPEALAPTERRKAKVRRAKQMATWVRAPNAQNPYAALEALRTRHQAYVTLVQGALEKLGTEVAVLDAHHAVKAVFESVWLREEAGEWRPSLPGDPLPLMAPMREGDASELLWPPLRHQICRYSAQRVTHSVARFGRTLVASADLTRGPQELWSFSRLRDSIAKEGIPFRVSMRVEAGGRQGAGWKDVAVSLLQFLDWTGTNKRIAESLRAVKAGDSTDTRVKLRMSFATWADAGDPSEIERRHSILHQLVTAWGFCDARQTCGDAVAAAMSSALGTSMASTAPAGLPPLSDVLRLFPWSRASSPFPKGTTIFRMEDGRMYPHEEGATAIQYAFDLFAGSMGGGKSVLMNRRVTATVLSAGNERMPLIGLVDIGVSSQGTALFLRDALPPHLKHLVEHVKLRMDRQFARNIFDTPLGCRRPWPDQRPLIVNMLAAIGTPAEIREDQGIPGMGDLCSEVVSELYRMFDDNEAQASPRRYLRGLEPRVDQALAELGLLDTPDQPMLWFGVVDTLFAAGKEREAHLAHRRAMPVLSDVIRAVSAPHIVDMVKRTLPGSSETLIEALKLGVEAALTQLPILAGETQWEPTARVLILDLQDVVGKQKTPIDEKQTAIMYQLALQTITRGWWCHAEDIATYSEIPDLYRRWHLAQAADTVASPKLLSADEVHRAATKGRSGFLESVEQVVRTGRKHNIRVMLASQRLSDYNESLIDLASGTWILTIDSEIGLEYAQRVLNLSNDVIQEMRLKLGHLHPGRGQPALASIKTKKGRYTQLLYNSIGPWELWALSTTPDDTHLRARLVERVGHRQALTLLAAMFPTGTAEPEIGRRVASHIARGEPGKATRAQVETEILDELLTHHTARMLQTTRAA